MMARTQLLDQMALFLLMGLLILSPWPLGSRLPWAAMLAAAVVIASGALWLAGSLVYGRRFAWNPLFVPIAVFLAWTGMQWAFGWTIYRHATAYEWVLYLSYAVTFALTVQVAGSLDRAQLLTRTIAAMGLAVGFFGLIQFFTWNGYLYWAYDPPYAGNRLGPFNNRNYFAGYMVASIGPALALILTGALRRGRAVFIYLTWIAAISVLVSLSRGGALALLATLGMVIALAPGSPFKAGSQPRKRKRLPGSSGQAHQGAAEPRGRRRAQRPSVAASRPHGSKTRALLVAATTIAILTGLVALQQTDRVLTRLETIFLFDQAPSLEGRLTMWREALPMVADRPLVGFGLNTFGWAFPQYRREPTSTIAMHAHNEYIEMLVETGVVGAALCAWFILLLYREGSGRLQRCSGSLERAIRLGSMAGWTGTLVFAVTDFPTIIPAINYLLAVLAALATIEIVGSEAARSQQAP